MLKNFEISKDNLRLGEEDNNIVNLRDVFRRFACIHKEENALLEYEGGIGRKKLLCLLLALVLYTGHMPGNHFWCS